MMKRILYTPLQYFTLLVLCLCAGNAMAATGFELSPDDSLKFSALAGATATQVVTVTSESDSTQMLTSSLSGSSAFTLSGLSTLTLLPHGTGTITILYSPSGNMESSGTLTVTGGGTTRTLALIGSRKDSSTGGSVTLNLPESLEFKHSTPGVANCQTLPITNTNVSAITISNFRITSGSSNFTTDQQSRFSVQPGQTVNAQVCFTPTVANQRVDGRLSVDYFLSLDSSVKGSTSVELEGRTSGDLDDTDSTRLNLERELDFGDVMVGQTRCLDLRVTNPTATTVTATNIRLDGRGASNFTFNNGNNGSVNLGPLVDTTFTICYTPTAADQEANAQIKFTLYGGNGNVFLGNYTVHISGSSFDSTNNGEGDEPCLRVRQNHELFGPVLRGGTTTDSIRIFNQTALPIVLTNAVVSGDNGFTVNSTFPVTIAANGSTTISATFHPMDSSKSAYHSTITFGVLGDLACGNTLTVNVNGVGIPGSSDDSDSINFSGNGNGSVVVNGKGNNALDTVQITNDLTVPVTITSVSLGGNGNFTIVGTTPGMPVTLQPGQSLSVIIRLNGDMPGYFSDQLIVTTQGGFEQQRFPLQSLRQAPNSVRFENNALINFALFPNPTNGAVHISLEGARTGSIEVLDLLGNVVARSNDLNWTWSGITIDGKQTSATYIVRASGIDVGGSEYHIARQLVMTK